LIFKLKSQTIDTNLELELGIGNRKKLTFIRSPIAELQIGRFWGKKREKKNIFSESLSSCHRPLGLNLTLHVSTVTTLTTFAVALSALLLARAQATNATTTAATTAATTSAPAADPIAAPMSATVTAAPKCTTDACCQTLTACGDCMQMLGCQFCDEVKDPKKPIVPSECKLTASVCKGASLAKCRGTPAASHAASHVVAAAAALVAAVAALM
jgi:hypothetical protein